MRFQVTIGLFALALAAQAQNIVSSYSHSGGMAASTKSVDYRYTRGGSPRTGYYWYWRQYTDQTTSNSLPVSLNSSPVGIKSIGNWYSPAYIGHAGGGAYFSNSPAHAEFAVAVDAGTLFQPTIAAHQGASVAASVNDTFTFTIAAPSFVSFNFSSSEGFGASLWDASANEAIWSGSGSGAFSDTLDAGTYTVKLNIQLSAGQDTQNGTSSNLGSQDAWIKARVSVDPGGNAKKRRHR